jgi:hypothetical protein
LASVTGPLSGAARDGQEKLGELIRKHKAVFSGPFREAARPQPWTGGPGTVERFISGFNVATPRLQYRTRGPAWMWPPWRPQSRWRSWIRSRSHKWRLDLGAATVRLAPPPGPRGRSGPIGSASLCWYLGGAPSRRGI